MVIGSQDTTLSALRLIRILADEAHKELGENAHRGSTARPTIKQLNNVLERLSSIVSLMDTVVLRELDLALIPNATDTEQRIVGRAVYDLLAAGYAITVNDGEEDTVKASKDAPTIFRALASTSNDTLGVTKAGQRSSFVFLVWGNGVDIISDYGMSLEDVLKGANELAEKLDEQERAR